MCEQLWNFHRIHVNVCIPLWCENFKDANGCGWLTMWWKYLWKVITWIFTSVLLCQFQLFIKMMRIKYAWQLISKIFLWNKKGNGHSIPTSRGVIAAIYLKFQSHTPRGKKTKTLLRKLKRWKQSCKCVHPTVMRKLQRCKRLWLVDNVMKIFMKSYHMDFHFSFTVSISTIHQDDEN